MSNLRIGIIGTGGMAKAHAEAFKKVRGVEVTACMDVVPGRAEAFAAAHSIALAASDRAAFFNAVDAVSIVTPDRFHAEPTIAALRAGKHVLCEKPLTVTLAEARQVARAAAVRPDLIGMVNFTYRRAAAAQQAAKLVAQGQLGTLRHVHAHYLQSWLVSDAWGHWTGEAWLWRLRTAAGSGGVLGDIGVHILDLTTMVAGDATRLRCDLRTFDKTLGRGESLPGRPKGDNRRAKPGGAPVSLPGRPKGDNRRAKPGGAPVNLPGRPKGDNRRAKPEGTPVNQQTLSHWNGEVLDANDSALIQLDLPGGAMGVVQATRWATGHQNHLRVEVHGTHGSLRFDLDESYERLHLCLGRDVHTFTWSTREFKPAPDVWQRFCKAVKTGQADQPDIARGAQVQGMLEACVRSAGSGKWQALPDAPRAPRGASR